MMRTRIFSWLNRITQHGLMDVALQTTELNICAYDGTGGQVDLMRDVIAARGAVVAARALAPDYTHANLDLALRHIGTAMIASELDGRLYAMSQTAEAVREAHRSLMRRCDEYRAMELAPC
jgi:hypothetical protein